MRHRPCSSSSTVGSSTNQVRPQHEHHSNPAVVTDFNHLLPPNMSFLDVALQTKEFQYLWFIKLVETQGLKAANMLADILRQVPTLASTQHQHQQQQPQLSCTERRRPDRCPRGL
uniref:(northern house mosquito) hypothetical protein n=1 Tax=Culex pipiens TaxID=7175 RepID=A0A8D8JQK5_CULPI